MATSSSAISDAKLVTLSLRNARMQIESDVWQMGDASDALNDDGALIHDALQDHKDVISSVLKRTGINLRKLKWSEIQEKYGVMAVTTLFCSCCAFIILRRLRVFVFLYFILSFLGLKNVDHRHAAVNELIPDRELLAVNSQISNPLYHGVSSSELRTFSEKISLLESCSAPIWPWYIEALDDNSNSISENPVGLVEDDDQRGPQADNRGDL